MLRHYRRLMLGLSALLVLLLLATAGVVVLRDQLKPVSAGSRGPVIITVRSGESVDQVISTLGQDHLVRNTLVFKVLADLRQLGVHLRAGRFALNRSMSSSEVEAVLAGPPLAETRKVTIPDGLDASQEAALLQKDGLFSAASYLSQVHSGKFGGISVLPGAPAGAGWEGMAFGDTFLVNRGITAHQFLRLQLQDFDRRVRSEVVRGAAHVGLTPYQSLILASIVSAEAATPKDRGLVAGVFYNRLHTGMPLESDVTVLYAEASAGQAGIPFNTKFPSPYNTYLHTGLPPGPIDSPGETAIEAALHPTSTDYLYFVALPDGKVLYSVTEAEHQQQVAEAGLG